MRRTINRAGAIIFGVGLAIGAAALWTSVPGQNAQLGSFANLGHLPIEDSPEPCPATAQLDISIHDVNEFTLNATRNDLSTDKIGFAEFLDLDDNQRRSVVAIVQNNGRSVYVQAALFTDTGAYIAAVDDALSKAHIHENTLCFDITLERLDGSGGTETWKGQLELH